MASRMAGNTVLLDPTPLAGALPAAGPLLSLTAAVLVVLFVLRSRHTGWTLDRSLPICAAGAVGALIGSRLCGLALNGALLQSSPEQWIGVRGTASWGGYVGAMVGVAAWCRIVHRSPWPALDVAASVAGLGTFVGRVGCFLAGCDFGRVTSLPWAVRFPPGSHAFRAHVASGVLAPDAAYSLAVHPLQLYLALQGVLLFLVASALWRRWRHVPGVTLAAFWILYGSGRFAWEFLRDAAAGGRVDGVSAPQYAALLAIGVGLAILGGVVRPTKRPRLSPARVSVP